jgi:hypothetical protein
VAEPAALEALVAAWVALVAALVALVEALVALLAALVADVEALAADVEADCSSWVSRVISESVVALPAPPGPRNIDIVTS